MTYQRGLSTFGVAMLIGICAVNATETEEAGVIVCVNDKWEETEPEKGHKLVDYAGRCVKVPDNATAPKATEECSGKYEYMADKSWKGSGGCTATFASGDKVFSTWEERSGVTAWPYTVTGGTGKYKDAKGSGTYFYENLTDTLTAGRYKGKW